MIQPKSRLLKQFRLLLVETESCSKDKPFTIFVSQHDDTAVKIELLPDVAHHHLGQLVDIEQFGCGLSDILNQQGAAVAIIDLLDMIFGRIALALNGTNQILPSQMGDTKPDPHQGNESSCIDRPPDAPRPEKEAGNRRASHQRAPQFKHPHPSLMEGISQEAIYLQ